MVRKSGFCQTARLSGQMVLRRRYGPLGAAGTPLGKILETALKKGGNGPEANVRCPQKRQIYLGSQRMGPGRNSPPPQLILLKKVCNFSLQHTFYFKAAYLFHIQIGYALTFR